MYLKTLKAIALTLLIICGMAVRAEPKVGKAIVDIAKQENYDLVVSEGVVHAGPKVDIADQILKKLEKK